MSKEAISSPSAASVDTGYKIARRPVGRVPSPGIPVPAPDEPPPRRLRRLERVWPDRDGNISYLLTLCVDGRDRVLYNEETIQRFVAFLLDSPTRYGWFGRRFVVMPDHIHLIAHQGNNTIRLGMWIKAMKAIVGGLERRGTEVVGQMPSPGERVGTDRDAASGDSAYSGGTQSLSVGRVPSHGKTVSEEGTRHEFIRTIRAWRWQKGFHDHKFRTPGSESKKWEYVCMNPVRYGLVRRPEDWPFGGEIFYEDAAGPRLVRGIPPLLEARVLRGQETPRGGTRPTV